MSLVNKRINPSFFFVLLALILSFNSARSQQWVPNDACWYYSYNEVFEQGYLKVYPVGDTIINNKQCQILEKKYYVYNSLLKKVTERLPYEYAHEIVTLEDDKVLIFRHDEFYTLYDFGAGAGESWIIPGYQDMGADSVSKVIVDSSGTEIINSDTFYWQAVHSPIGAGWGFGSSPKDGKTIIYNKFGSTGYLFPLQLCGCNTTEGGPLRCYTDKKLGTFTIGISSECDIIIDTTASIKDDNDSGIRIYPNPATSFVNVSIPKNTVGINIRIYNFMGREIMKGVVNEHVNIVNINELLPGIYYLDLERQGSMLFREILVKL